MPLAPISVMNCLFFETQAEEAARHYVSVFPNSSIDVVNHFPSTGQEVHQQPAGSVMSVAFTLNSTKWVALNSRPKNMPMTEAVSFQIICEGQDDIDHYFDELTKGISEEDKARQMCGWLRDRFGVSWQVVPKSLMEVMSGGDKARMAAVMAAFMKMKKIVIKDLEEALAGIGGE